VDFGLLIRVGKAANQGQRWRLVIDDSQIDWAALEARIESRGKSHQKKMETARRHKSLVNGINQHAGKQHLPATGKQHLPALVNGINPLKDHIETQGNTSSSSTESSTNDSAPSPIAKTDEADDLKQLMQEATEIAQQKAASDPPHGSQTDEPDTDSDLADVVQAYTDNIGMIGPLIREEIIAALDEFPKWWVLDAIKEGATHSARSWKYVSAVLSDWRANGHARTPDSADPPPPTHVVLPDIDLMDEWEKQYNEYWGAKS
jgi:DnaD/phage-associated family protein